MRKYILDENSNPVLCDNPTEWGQWFETGERRVRVTQVGNVIVSTVFLGLDHSFANRHGDPILYETMIFRLDGDKEDSVRWNTREDSIKGHEMMVRSMYKKQTDERGQPCIVQQFPLVIPYVPRKRQISFDD